MTPELAKQVRAIETAILKLMDCSVALRGLDNPEPIETILRDARLHLYDCRAKLLGENSPIDGYSLAAEGATH